MNITAALFPGQGSQSVGMGSSFHESSDITKEIFSRADKALGFKLSKICFEGPAEKLTQTEFAQPALLTASYCAFSEFSAKGKKVHVAAGHSLGEYSALVSAEVISFEDAVVLVNKRGQYMQEAVPSGQGGMLAIMGPSEKEIADTLSKIDTGVAQIANLNSNGQTVVAGDIEGLKQCTTLMKEQGAKVIPLKVSAPFHCSLMKPAEQKLSVDLDATTFSEPQFKVYANVTAKQIKSGDDARELLKQQVCSSVRWTDTMLNFKSEQKVVKTIEFGAGGVLSKLLKRIVPEIERLEVSSPESLKKTLSAV